MLLLYSAMSRYYITLFLGMVGNVGLWGLQGSSRTSNNVHTPNLSSHLGFPVAQTVRNLCAVQECMLSCWVMSISWRPHGLWSDSLLCPSDSPSKNTGVGCHSFPQGIFLTQGSKPGLLHCRWSLYCLNHQGSPFDGLGICMLLMS